MQSQSDKAIEIDGLTGRLRHGLVVLVLVVVVVLLPDSTRYVGIVYFIHKNSYVTIREAVMSDS